MSYKIAKHILSGPDVEYIVTNGKDSGLFAEGLPDTIVIHYTAGASLESSVDTLRDPEVQASAHIVVGRDGRIKQLIPFNKIAWHAGVSEWEGRTYLNRYAIGIEIDNAGRLNKVGDQYQAWWGGFIPADEVFQGVHRNESEPSFWQAYTEKQISIVLSLCRLLKSTYNIDLILGHEEIAPGRKTDPGPAFPLDKLRQLLLESRGDADIGTEAPEPKTTPTVVTGIVSANSLNFRVAPSLSAPLKSEPLPQFTQLEIISEENGWYKVKVCEIGWVKKDYVSITS